MRLRTRMVAAGMALGMMAGLSSFVAQPAGAAPITVTLDCAGADDTSQQILDLLGGMSTPPTPPPVHLAVSAEVTPTLPDNVATGNSAPVSFDAKLLLPADLVSAAVGLGITQLGVSGVDLGVKATGGGTGGPYSAAPTSFTIGLSPLNVPTLSASGNVTITDDAKPTLFAVVDPVKFTVSIDLGGDQPLVINLSCAVPAGTYVGAINGSIPTPPTTIATTTTTKAAAAAAVTQPHFTG